MTKRERFLAFASFEQVDRVPRKIGCVDDLRQIMTEPVYPITANQERNPTP